jgi:hypothetical protein
MLMAVACAGSPPEFPNGTLGDNRGGTIGGAEGGDEDTETATSGIGGNSGGLDDTGPVGSSGVMPSDDSGGGSTSGPPMMMGSTGEPDPFYMGDFQGSWQGSCSDFPVIGSIGGGGMWSVTIDEQGNIDGDYTGNVDYAGSIGGGITGQVDDKGNQTATADGPDLGECSWDGLIDDNGAVNGDIRCADYDCDGTFSGYKVAS